MNINGQKLEFKDYNGWTNRDTWLVMLWVNNDQENYNKVKEIKDDINNLTDKELYNFIKNLKTLDKINYNNVNLTEIRENLEV